MQLISFIKIGGSAEALISFPNIGKPCLLG